MNTINSKHRLTYLYSALFLMLLNLFFFSSCSKLVEVSPPENAITQENVYNDDLTAAAVMTNLYGRISSAGTESYGLLVLSKLTGLSADEFNLWSGADLLQNAYFMNDLAAPASASNGVFSAGHELWDNIYPLIYICNSAIKGLTTSQALTPTVKQQLLGEAKFMRAFFYFYLVNLYGDVPLAIGIDPEVNRLLPRSPQSNVYDLIEKDLLDAENTLSPNYLNSGLRPYANGIQERVRPTKWAASALLARVYLYTKNYSQAEDKASIVINNTSLFGLSALAGVFLKNSSEAIWQLQPVELGWNTAEARGFCLTAAPEGFSNTKSIYLNPNLLTAFEDGDSRKDVWVNTYNDASTTYYFPYKYINAIQDENIATTSQMTEYSMVLRLAEQYLIRAEAKAQQNKIIESVTDLNMIRGRARAFPTATIPNPLPPIANSISQSQLLSVIQHERQIELFSEWGHRWFDLKRTGNINKVMSIVTPQKGGVWGPTDQLYPIPYSDIQRNPSLTGHQNDGY